MAAIPSSCPAGVVSKECQLQPSILPPRTMQSTTLVAHGMMLKATRMPGCTTQCTTARGWRTPFTSTYRNRILAATARISTANPIVRRPSPRARKILSTSSTLVTRQATTFTGGSVEER
ncbi:uncharacterized protein BKA78DRAFT_328230 [Phyllosticta capitalensis]|uniref:uncharacterized protein n=1 Tax=Phyllosticta capitalensis TaxID=121624 RepID=UPI003132421B